MGSTARPSGTVVRFGLWRYDLQSGQVACCLIARRLCGLGRRDATLDYAQFLHHVVADDRAAFEAGIASARAGRPAVVDYQSMARRGASAHLRVALRASNHAAAPHSTPTIVLAATQTVGHWARATEFSDEFAWAAPLSGTKASLDARSIVDSPIDAEPHLLDHILKQAPLGVAHVGADGRLLDVGPALSVVLGYPLHPGPREQTESLVHPLDAPTIQESVRRLLAGADQRLPVRLRLLRSDGSSVWAGGDLALLAPSNGQPPQVIWAIRETEPARPARPPAGGHNGAPNRSRSASTVWPVGQQLALVRLARRALRANDLSHLMRSASSAISNGLGLKHVAILRLDPAHGRFVLAAGTGWSSAARQAEIAAAPALLPGFALHQGELVVWPDWSDERRCAVPRLFLDHGLTGGAMTVIGGGRAAPYGVLGVFSERPRPFTLSERTFLSAASGILSAAVRREQAEDARAELAKVLEASSDVVALAGDELRLKYLNRAGRAGLGQREGDDISDISLADLFPPDARRRLMDEAVPAAMRLGSWGGESTIIGPGRTSRPVSLVVLTAQNRAQGAPDVAIIARDMSERNRLEQEILAVSDREQQRIGQDLHDDLCQQLTAAQFLAQLLQRQLSAAERAEARQAGDVADQVRHAVERVRAMARGLRPIATEARGLVPAMREMLQSLSRIYKVRVDFRADPAVPLPSQDVATQIYRITQEAASNAIRHGGARKLWVRLEPAPKGNIQLVVRDDGRGLPPEYKESSGMGIHIMRHRAGAVGGTFALAAIPHGGAEVQVSVPAQGAAGSGRRSGEAVAEP